MKHAAEQFKFSKGQVFLGSHFDLALAIESKNFGLIFPCKKRTSVDEVMVDGSKAEHIAFDSQTHPLDVLDLQDFRGHEARSAASHEDVARLVDVRG